MKNDARDSVVRWGIIGCGSVCEVKSGPALYKAEGSALVAVMRRDGAKAADFARRHNVPRWYDEAQRLIDDPEVDVVYIATPPGLHLEYALRVAAAGKPCYVEKPMARSHAECRRMVEAFDRAGVKLFVAYYRRGLPRFVKARELILSGALGRVTGCTYRHTRLFWPDPPAQWRLDPAQSGGGLLLDLGSHTLDLLDYLLGEFVEVGGCASRFSSAGVEDAVSLHFRTATGVVGSACWNFAGCTREDTIVIDGTAGQLVMNTFAPQVLTLNTPDGQQRWDLPDPPHVQQPLVQTIVDELRGRGVCPSTGQSAARTSRVMDAALARFYRGREDEFWNRPQDWGR